MSAPLNDAALDQLFRSARSYNGYHDMPVTRAQMDAIVVGGKTLRADKPRLDVRLPGLAARSPERWVMTSDAVPEGWLRLERPEAITTMGTAQYLMIEGGAETSRAFLRAGLVDRMLLYRAPPEIAGSGPALPELIETVLGATGDWQHTDQRTLGKDRLDVYECKPCSPE